jgi:hypothetical protein
MNQIWNVLTLGGLTLAAIALQITADPVTVGLVVVWTARSALLLFVTGFVLLGQDSGTGIRKIACRTAAVAMGLHLLALLRLLQITEKPPVPIATLPGALVVLSGAAAAAIVLAGWLYEERRWYRWAVYWPWGYFLLTYVKLARHSTETTRVLAMPLSYLPSVVLLVVALGWRVYSDFKDVRRRQPNKPLQQTGQA